jgi:hypothetical protein
MIGWLAFGAVLGFGLVRIGWGYARPAKAPLLLSARELAFVAAAADATFPAGGALPPSGSDAGVAAYADRWLAVVQPRMRLLIRLLFFLVEHATLFFPAPGRLGFRRFTSLSAEQQAAALEGWRTSRFRARRLVFESLRAIVAMAYLAHPPLLRQLGLAPRRIESPVCEADLLFPPIGAGPEAIRWTREDLDPAGRSAEPLTADAPIDPRFAEPAP